MSGKLLFIFFASLIGIDAQQRLCPRCINRFNPASCIEFQTCHEHCVMHLHREFFHSVEFTCGSFHNCDNSGPSSCHQNNRVQCSLCCENVQQCLSDMKELFPEPPTTHAPPATTKATPTSSPHTTTVTTVNSTAIPTTTTAIPTTTTAIPTTTTAIPPTTTVIPTNTTAIPSTSTAIPTNTTAIPPTTIAIPTNTTAIPPTSTAIPTNTTAIPPATTVIPSTSTAIPTDTTAIPTDTTAIPPTTTVILSNTTPIPPTSTVISATTVTDTTSNINLSTSSASSVSYTFTTENNTASTHDFEVIILTTPPAAHSCVQCGDFASNKPCTSIELLLNRPTTCLEGFPYCFETVNLTGGNIQVTRGCAEPNFCRVEWDIGHSRQGCYPLDLTSDSLSCTYCCKGNLCNVVTPPEQNAQVIFP